MRNGSRIRAPVWYDARVIQRSRRPKVLGASCTRHEKSPQGPDYSVRTSLGWFGFYRGENAGRWSARWIPKYYQGEPILLAEGRIDEYDCAECVDRALRGIRRAMRRFESTPRKSRKAL